MFDKFYYRGSFDIWMTTLIFIYLTRLQLVLCCLDVEVCNLLQTLQFSHNCNSRLFFIFIFWFRISLSSKVYIMKRFELGYCSCRNEGIFNYRFRWMPRWDQGSYFLLVVYGLCFRFSGCDLANFVQKLESTMIGRAICDKRVRIYLFDNDATFLFLFLTCTQVNEFSSFLGKKEKKKEEVTTTSGNAIHFSLIKSPAIGTDRPLSKSY